MEKRTDITKASSSSNPAQSAGVEQGTGRPDIAKVSPALEPQFHLSAEQLLELVERGKRHKNYTEYIDHILVCPICRETYKQLLETEASIREVRRPRAPVVWRWGLGLTAAAAALILVVWFNLPSTPPSWQVALRTVNGVAYEGATRLPDWLADARALYESPPSVTRSGAAPSSSFALIAPDPANEGLDTPTPTFEWRALTQAERYFALLEPLTKPGQPIVLKVAGTRATLPEGTQLASGERYRLRLSASAQTDTLMDEAIATYEFRVLSSEELSYLRWAHENASNAPYASALTLYQLGYYRESLNLLRRLPKDPITDQWLRAVEEQILLRGGTL